MNPATPKEIFERIDKLIDGWCERRALAPLRQILRSYPLASGLTDEWGELLNSLKDVKVFCKDALVDAETREVKELIR
jgi:hypothetical protein